MKRFLLPAVAAAAVLTLGGCTKTETVNVSENRFIEFDAFIWKSTKAVEEVKRDNIKSFYVLGQKTSNNGAPTDFFLNEQVYESATPGEWIYDDRKMWEENTTYTFAAYSNGGLAKDEDGTHKIANVGWDGTQLTITDYNAAQQANDLLVSIASNSTEVGTSNVPVQFSFQHALSMIKFTIKSELGDNNNAIEISKFKVSGINAQASLTYTTGNINWTDWSVPKDLLAEKFTTTTSVPGASEPFVVIPGEEGVGFTVTFTATFIDDVDGTYKQDLTATISDQKFTAGYRYNYIATITGADMKVITFEKPDVTPWTDDSWGDNGPVISDLN